MALGMAMGMIFKRIRSAVRYFLNDKNGLHLKDKDGFYLKTTDM